MSRKRSSEETQKETLSTSRHLDGPVVPGNPELPELLRAEEARVPDDDLGSLRTAVFVHPNGLQETNGKVDARLDSKTGNR